MKKKIVMLVASIYFSAFTMEQNSNAYARGKDISEKLPSGDRLTRRGSDSPVLVRVRNQSWSLDQLPSVEGTVIPSQTSPRYLDRK